LCCKTFGGLKATGDLVVWSELGCNPLWGFRSLVERGGCTEYRGRGTVGAATQSGGLQRPLGTWVLGRCLVATRFWDSRALSQRLVHWISGPTPVELFELQNLRGPQRHWELGCLVGAGLQTDLGILGAGPRCSRYSFVQDTPCSIYGRTPRRATDARLAECSEPDRREQTTLGLRAASMET
jgi:hypothetical protein